LGTKYVFIPLLFLIYLLAASEGHSIHRERHQSMNMVSSQRKRVKFRSRIWST